jgi:hypothetical protein
MNEQEREDLEFERKKLKTKMTSYQMMLLGCFCGFLVTFILIVPAILFLMAEFYFSAKIKELRLEIERIDKLLERG